MDASRSQILNALRNSRTGIPFSESQDLPKIPEPEWNLEEKVERLKNRMEAVHTEIHECTEKGFGKIFREVIKQKKITNLLYGKKTNWGNKLEAMRQRGPKTMPELIPYQKKIEDCKETLFSIDAGLTQTMGAIAETGSLILKPDGQEPRLLSLVPPIHLAVLDSKRIYSTFGEAIREEGWSRPMPTNVLLISGPSKTADIEQTLVYGIHGPKQLILFLIR